MAREPHQTVDMQVHFGRWLYWTLRERFKNDKHAAEQAIGRQWQTIRKWFHQATPATVPEPRLVDIEQGLGMPYGASQTAYLDKPYPPVPRDPRGVQPHTTTMYRARFALPQTMIDRAVEFGNDLGLNLNDILTEALDNWLAYRAGPGPTVEPSRPSRGSGGRKPPAGTKPAGSGHQTNPVGRLAHPVPDQP